MKRNTSRSESRYNRKRQKILQKPIIAPKTFRKKELQQVPQPSEAVATYERHFASFQPGEGNNINALSHFPTLLKPTPEELTSYHDAQSGNRLFDLLGKGAQLHNITDAQLDMHYKVLDKVDQRVLTNLAKTRGVKKPGRGFIGAVGKRFDYAQTKESGKQVLVDSAKHHDCTDDEYCGFRQSVQFLANTLTHAIKSFSPHEIIEQEAHMDVLTSTPGTASFAFPMALVSKHGSYGVHKDERDISRTFWLVLGEAGIVFPEYGVSVKLAHGDIVAFDGKALWHAATSHPNPPKQHRQITVALYYQSQQDSYFYTNLENLSGTNAT